MTEKQQESLDDAACFRMAALALALPAALLHYPQGDGEYTVQVVDKDQVAGKQAVDGYS